MNKTKIWNWICIVMILAGEISLIIVYSNNIGFISPALIIFPVSLLCPFGNLFFKIKINPNHKSNNYKG